MITRKNRLGALAVFILALLILPWHFKILLAGVVAVVYLISLPLHSNASCGPCGGSGRHWGRVFGWTNRMCGTCGGQSRHRRLGVRVFYGNRRTWSEKRQVAAGRRRGRMIV